MMMTSMMVVWPCKLVTKETEETKYRDGDSVEEELLQIYRCRRRQVEQLRLIRAGFVHFHFLKRGNWTRKLDEQK